MSAPTPVCLRFGEEATSIVRARISYAFRVFAAIFSGSPFDSRFHDPILESNELKTLKFRATASI
jgi:hypothetical protein